MKEKYQTEKEKRAEIQKNRGTGSSLVLYNDDHNDFDFVIESLVKVCEHDIVQAEQCTFIAHFKGKCEIKKGNRDVLRAMQMSLIDRGLTAEVI